LQDSEILIYEEGRKRLLCCLDGKLNIPAILIIFARLNNNYNLDE
jgi:hypothetical protein